ncbi:hypothetical protein CYLTODRAFT_418412 [Cylindrobasidium torrendii FP15055 ss-10]|uniref:Arrestin-like N-terminal domain-containing protein n=1 Tax=Cylindrobasidium torrendii FP15055 ss-10 TaxID=1314674 RepID=A0A0D7BNU2_9AGAR|nr:hypothetical protein CYLTODRAFT_418412 [Cylindrobasidium torrendii FP15055 ss-10]
MSFPPTYSALLPVGEARLEHTPSRHSHRHSDNDTWLKKDGRIAIALSQQDRNAPIPVYGRRGNIHGAMLFDDRNLVESVSIKLLGQIRVGALGEERVVNMVDAAISLWPIQNGTLHEACPSALPFSIDLPSNFQDPDDKTSKPLAPSIDVRLNGLEALVDYALLVRIQEKKGHSAYRIFNRDSQQVGIIRIPLIYRPAYRPSEPVLEHPAFLESVKVVPESWKQSITYVKTKTASVYADPISCSLFFPSVQVFAISEPIPIHVQMTSTLSSLLLFFPARNGPPSPTDSTKHFVLKLIRRYNIEINGKTTSRSAAIGAAVLQPVPPLASSSPPGVGQDALDHMDWAAELYCNPDVTVGSFSSSGCCVKDYIVLEVYPHPTSPFVKTTLAVGVTIVTDPWTDGA